MPEGTPRPFERQIHPGSGRRKAPITPKGRQLDPEALAEVQALLGDPLSALLTFGVFLLNVGLNAAQQLYATNRVEALLALTRPLATVIRDGRVKSADIDEIVTGGAA